MDLTLVLAVVLFIIAALLLALLVYSGLLVNISVDARKSPYGELLVYYKTHVGPYANVGDLFCETRRLVPTLRLIGIYLDDPKYTLAEHCRAAVGAIVSDAAGADAKRLAEAGFAVKTLPKADNVVYCTFPVVNLVSVYISVWRVYPAIRSYLADHQLTARPFIEVHDSGHIAFLAPLSRYEEFEPDIKVPSTPQPQPSPVSSLDRQSPSPPPVVDEAVESVKSAEAEQPPPAAATATEAPATAVDCTEEALVSEISEAVTESTASSSSPPVSRNNGEVETVFANQHDLIEAMADRPDDLEQEAEVKEEAEAEPEPEADAEFVVESPIAASAQAAVEAVPAAQELLPTAPLSAERPPADDIGDEGKELADLEQRLAQLEEDLTDKQSRVRSDVNQLNNNLALAEIEEHLRRTAGEQSELEASADSASADDRVAMEFSTELSSDQQIEEDFVADSNDSGSQGLDKSVEDLLNQQEPESHRGAEIVLTFPDQALNSNNNNSNDDLLIEPTTDENSEREPSPHPVEQSELPVELHSHSPAAEEPATQDDHRPDAEPDTVPLIQLQPAVQSSTTPPASMEEAESADAAPAEPQVSLDQVDQFVQSVVLRAQQICAADTLGDCGDPGTERREKRLPSPLRHQTSRSSSQHESSPDAPEAEPSVAAAAAAVPPSEAPQAESAAD